MVSCAGWLPRRSQPQGTDEPDWVLLNVSSSLDVIIGTVFVVPYKIE